MVANLYAAGAAIFFAFWLILSVSTFGLHHKLDHHEEGWPSHKMGSPDETRVDLEARIGDLESHVHAAENALEHLVVAATAQHRAAILKDAQSSVQVAPVAVSLARGLSFR